ncbi:hypothetical protein GLAREA_07395 [Glarea lozoyensis ATCC 20868]|uniref:Heterokaryon incompatibility domain-containing protein n=1 Tax=Glarea lozoyensis (strain ATCC 20868 / MF5171) TaxID=1116229 RepID=S3D172_GLAL2|nr:uncharacterized protein GLAREA_07395 [Glarea lozoyensis ATCC 20868]EPE32262.1 hypothetical protein GLAREA_07395 [Glarea lozoyensis ATCC 20868]
MNVLPLRVIDVETMCLRQTGNEENSYAALSYCWGGDQLFKTTRANISSRIGGARLDGLPRTLLDAVQVCKQLQIRYLWVDALCIIQDDETDKAREIAKMRMTFNRATLVIAASRARDANAGFLEDANIPSDGVVMLPAKFSETCRGEVGIVKVPLESSGHEPLNQRGWAYQEISLARRALIYTDQGMVWQCSAVFDRLAYDGMRIRSHPSHDLVVATQEFEPGPVQRDIWDQLVRIYTLRNLTFPDDRLEALAGIAAMAASMWNNRYFAGLWEQDMQSQLGWRVDNTALANRNWKALEAPSWSWASVDGSVCDVVRSFYAETPREARVISCEVKLASRDNPFGRVVSGRLTIEGYTVEARYAKQSWLENTRMDFDGRPLNVEDLDDT